MYTLTRLYMYIDSHCKCAGHQKIGKFLYVIITYITYFVMKLIFEKKHHLIN